VTQTVYGFLDFVTTIGNTVMIFTPQTKKGKLANYVFGTYGVCDLHPCQTNLTWIQSNYSPSILLNSSSMSTWDAIPC
jgi:hypothetical protein